MNGISKWSPFIPESPFLNSRNSPEEIAARIQEKIEYINNWQTLMNIVGFECVQDPLSKNIHFTISFKDLLRINDLADTVCHSELNRLTLPAQPCPSYLKTKIEQLFDKIDDLENKLKETQK